MTVVRAKCPDHGIVDQYHTKVVVDLESRKAIIECPFRHSFVAPLNDGVLDLLIKGGCDTIDEHVSAFAAKLEEEL